MNHKNNILIATIFLLLIPLVNAVIITGQSSSYTFNVTNCQAYPNTTLSCSPATIKFECDFYNPSFINSVSFRVENQEFSTIQNSTDPNKFYLLYNKPTDTSSTSDPVTLDREQITDVASQSVNAFLVVDVPRNCVTCNVGYTQNIIQACNISNVEIIEFISSNETCSPSYNSTQSCNYCSPSIFANYTTCTQNNTQTVSFFDTNYATCCLATGLAEDCLINTPTYATRNQTCNYYSEQFSCEVDPYPVINDKISVNCELPDDRADSCVVNLYQGLSLLQTNPEYKSTSQSFILAKDQETRTTFTPNNRLLNGYYSDKELRPNTPYRVEIVCTGTNFTLKSSYEVIPEYHIPDGTFNRFVWFGDNAVWTISATIGIILLIILIIFLIRKIRNR